MHYNWKLGKLYVLKYLGFIYLIMYVFCMFILLYYYYYLFLFLFFTLARSKINSAGRDGWWCCIKTSSHRQGAAADGLWMHGCRKMWMCSVFVESAERVCSASLFWSARGRASRRLRRPGALFICGGAHGVGHEHWWHDFEAALQLTFGRMQRAHISEISRKITSSVQIDLRRNDQKLAAFSSSSCLFSS